LPAWNPYSLAGVPWLGDPQSALFLSAELAPYFADAEKLASWLMVGHHLLAGFGVYLSALPTAFSGSLRVADAATWGAFTWWAHAALGIILRRSESSPGFPGLWRLNGVVAGSLAVLRARAGALAMCFFCGHVQELFYLVLILWSLVLTDVLVGWRQIEAASSGEPDGGMRIRLFGAMACLRASRTVGLTAIELVPMWI